jgi:hypothetical protein
MASKPQIMDVGVWEFLGIAPNEELTVNAGEPLSRTVAAFLGKRFVELRDRDGVLRAGLRDEDEGTALVIFAYSVKPADVPVTSVGEESQLLLQGDNVSVTLAVTAGKQRKLLSNAPLKRKEAILAIATDRELLHWGTMEVVQS